MKNTTSILIVICLSQGKTQYKSSLSFKRSDKRKIAIALAADDKMVAITILLGIIPLAPFLQELLKVDTCLYRWISKHISFLMSLLSED